MVRWGYMLIMVIIESFVVIKVISTNVNGLCMGLRNGSCFYFINE